MSAEWWLCTDFGPGALTCDAAWVEAANADEAAALALPELQGARHGDDAEPVEHVFVVNAADRTAYVVEATTRRAEHQCCGGLETGRHACGCPATSVGEQGLFPPREVPE